ncbi:hypothetical protein QBC35DRAFT_550639, partial [Podospora australis]
MEAAGLSVGVIALAGLFKDIIDIFALFTASRELGRSYEHLETKLELEKTLPLAQALRCIHQLLSDASVLQGRYGVSQEASNNDTDNQLVVSTQAGPTLMERFVRDFAAFQPRVDRRPKPSAGTRVRWVIRDKEKFDALIKDPTFYVSKLKELVPPERESETKQDRRMSQDCHESHCVPKRIKQEDPTPNEDRATKLSDSILAFLWFSTIYNRRESISEEHSGTYRWASEKPNSNSRPWDDLSQWLRSGKGMYWLSGKAGSGKST